MDQNAKQQIVEKLLSANNVLVTVSQNPTVDQLSAALGLSLMLNELDKRASAVFSGQIPDVMEFLQPEKSIDNNVDGLRDFIISIDKEKADKLRYKVEDNLVRIFITPYKTTLTEDDLSFTQGDFNVDVIVALGVSDRNDLDQAIISHGRILHDATIASITAGNEPAGDLGAINWHDPNASSLSEMLVSMSEALQSGILDRAMASAFLTGIVSATERFSNNKTTPKVMTMSAQLMAAGADQQLIAKNLRMDRGRTKDLQKPPSGDQVVELHAERNTSDDGLQTLANLSNLPDTQRPPAQPPPTPPVEAIQPPSETPKGVNRPMAIKDVKSDTHEHDTVEKPSMGGTWNATSEQAHRENIKAHNEDMNHEVLDHPKAPAPPPEPPVVEQKEEPQPTPIPEPNPSLQPPSPDPNMLQPEVPKNEPEPLLQPAPLPDTEPKPSLPKVDKKPEQSGTAEPSASPEDLIKNARSAVDSAINKNEFDPAHHPEERNAAQLASDAEQVISHEIEIDEHGKMRFMTEPPASETANSSPTDHKTPGSANVNSPDAAGSENVNQMPKASAPSMPPPLPPKPQKNTSGTGQTLQPFEKPDKPASPASMPPPPADPSANKPPENPLFNQQ